MKKKDRSCYGTGAGIGIGIGIGIPECIEERESTHWHCIGVDII
jgi:hypothetical protein